MVFSKRKSSSGLINPAPVERVTSVIGPGLNWKGDLKGKGGVRIEGTLEGEIAVRGLVVVGETGRISCETLKADSVIVAGYVKGNILCERLDIRATGRVWGDVVTVTFATEEGAFLRGQIRMEDSVDLNIPISIGDDGTGEDKTLTNEG